MSPPRLPPGEKRRNLTVRLEPKNQELLQHVSKVTSRSQGRIINRLIETRIMGLTWERP